MRLTKVQQKEFGICILGAVGYAIIINLLVQPLYFVSGSVTGLAMLLTHITQSLFHLSTTFNLTGIFLIFLNLPLLFLAKQLSNKMFIYKTILVLIVSLIAFSIIPVPAKPILNDPLAVCFIAGLGCGYCCGITLRAGGSTAGLDIVGIYMTARFKNFSVGKVSMGLSLIVYALTFYQFDFGIVIYSIIFTFVSSLIVDRIHYQNIKCCVWIISDHPDIKNLIINEIKRSATRWKGEGLYTGNPRQIYLTIVSKFEVLRIKRLIKQIDPHAFIVISDSQEVYGSFQMRIDSELTQIPPFAPLMKKHLKDTKKETENSKVSTTAAAPTNSPMNNSDSNTSTNDMPQP